mmetsp:Transcript_21863/g.85658  ORF Transcript_21863/g.85658 Transcript_21863/m.85658 type:complete len:234 (+) Transcript_21863:6367-7068(+)
MRSASSRQMDRPSPVPPKRRVVESSAWVKGRNSLACSSGATPTPLSLTASRTRSPPSGDSVRWMWPRSVNFNALTRKLAMIWRTRSGSPMTRRGRPGASSMRMSRPRSRPNAAQPSKLAWARACRSNSVFSRSRRPAWILDRSSTLQTISFRDSAALARWRRYSARRASLLPGCWSSRARPSTPLSGVRISWLMVARKALLAWLAVSAWSLAACSSRSCWRRSVTSSASHSDG